jgi:arylamine N-acetyltransferase
VNYVRDPIALSVLKVEQFLDLIDVGMPQKNNLAELRSLVTKFLEYVPFQNFTMLLGPRRRPTWNEICQAMLGGMGGLCTARNPFLKCLLETIGYEVYFISASMKKPNCHIGLVVSIDQQKYWVDVGNGYPYMEPYPLGKNITISHPFLDYRVTELEGIWTVEHKLTKDGWMPNQTFADTPVPYSSFDKMHELNYTVEGWGPFLTGLRANRWLPDGGYILKDFSVSNLHQKHTIEDLEEFQTWIEQAFPNSPLKDEGLTTAVWDFFLTLKEREE